MPPIAYSLRCCDLRPSLGDSPVSCDERGKDLGDPRPANNLEDEFSTTIVPVAVRVQFFRPRLRCGRGSSSAAAGSSERVEPSPQQVYTCHHLPPAFGRCRPPRAAAAPMRTMMTTAAAIANPIAKNSHSIPDVDAGTGTTKKSVRNRKAKLVLNEAALNLSKSIHRLQYWIAVI